MQNGFQNEIELIAKINGKKYDQLNFNLKKIIDIAFKNKNGEIKCVSGKGGHKSDILIIIGEESHSFSIKKGTGNSLHQEPVNDFLIYLKNKFGLKKEVKECILDFIWADKTLDGTGKVMDRISASKYKKLFPRKILKIQNYFNEIKSDLIKRFLIDGKDSKESAEFIYYGNAKNGFCCSSNNSLNWLVNNKSNGAISVGRLSFQAWNRNINGGKKSEKKRGVIQLKWGTIKDDIKKISNE